MLLALVGGTWRRIARVVPDWSFMIFPLCSIPVAERLCVSQNPVDAGLGPVGVLELCELGEVAALVGNPLAGLVQWPANWLQRGRESKLLAVHEEPSSLNQGSKTDGVPTGVRQCLRTRIPERWMGWADACTGCSACVQRPAWAVR